MGEEIKRTSLVNQVYSSILNRIQKGAIKQGERLNIEDLAENFGVSRTPVREAISKLTQEGFVEQLYNSGPRVVQFQHRQILDIIRANATLFSGVMESYASMDPDTYCNLILQLSEVLNAQSDANSCDDINTFYKKSVEFHIVLIEACTNEVTKKYAMQTQYQINMCALYYQKEISIRQKSIREHEAILTSLKEKDREKAIILMKSHNRFAEETFLNMIENKDVEAHI